MSFSTVGNKSCKVWVDRVPAAPTYDRLQYCLRRVCLFKSLGNQFDKKTRADRKVMFQENGLWFGSLFTRACKEDGMENLRAADPSKTFCGLIGPLVPGPGRRNIEEFYIDSVSHFPCALRFSSFYFGCALPQAFFFDLAWLLQVAAAQAQPRGQERKSTGTSRSHSGPPTAKPEKVRTRRLGLLDVLQWKT